MQPPSNKIKCNKCGDVIESIHQHDFKYCQCGAGAVDGGKEYLSRCFTNSADDFTDLSECEDSVIFQTKFDSFAFVYQPKYLG